MNKYKILNQVITPFSKVSNEFLEKCRNEDRSFRDLIRYPMLGDLVMFRVWEEEHHFSKVFNIYIGKVTVVSYVACNIRAQYQVIEEDGHRECKGREIIKDISTTWDNVYPINLSNGILEDLGFERYLYGSLPKFNYKLKIQGGSLYINAYKKGRCIEDGYREFFYLKNNNFKYNNKGSGKYLHQLIAYLKNLELETAIGIEAEEWENLK